MPTRPAGQRVWKRVQSLKGPPNMLASRAASVCLSHVQRSLGGSGWVSKLLRCDVACRCSSSGCQPSAVSSQWHAQHSQHALTQLLCSAHRPAPEEQSCGPC